MSSVSAIPVRAPPPPATTEWYLREPGWRLKWMASAAVLVSLGMLAALIFATGGTHTAYTNLLLFPGLFSAAVFGWRGGVICAIVGGLLLGPWMPQDTGLGTSQPTHHWIARLLIYVVVAAAAGWMFERLRAIARQLSNLAFRNTVTGLPNRETLLRDLRASNRARNKRLLALITIQVTGYRDVVSVMGGDAESELQKQIGERLLEAASHNGGTVYQESGDLYLMALPAETSNDALYQACAVVRTLERRVVLGRYPAYVGAHAGIDSCLSDDQRATRRLLTRSRMALSQAVQNRRPIVAFESAANKARRRQLVMLGELERAISEDRLTLHYQPIIDIRTGALTSLEVLVRWHHERYGNIAPGYFIPAAEQTSLIHPLTRWVIHTAVRERATVLPTSIDAPLSINVSAHNLSHNELVPLLLDIQRGLKPGSLIIELTETALTLDPDRVTANLRVLAEAGIVAVIDDFGTGYSSLKHLRDLPVSTLKIDRAFVSRMTTHHADRRIVEASISMATSLGLTTVAEGVEDSDTLALLEQLGCHCAQGYLIARPMSATEANAWIDARHRKEPQRHAVT